MHSGNLIHRDVKPANILVDDNCNIKFCDFGLTRGTAAKKTHKRNLSPHMQTRYYRAPEVVLMQHYDTKADIWSLGCVLAELVNTLKPVSEEERMQKKAYPFLFEGKSCYPLSPCKEALNSDNDDTNVVDQNDQLLKILNYLGPQS